MVGLTLAGFNVWSWTILSPEVLSGSAVLCFNNSVLVHLSDRELFEAGCVITVFVPCLKQSCSI